MYVKKTYLFILFLFLIFVPYQGWSQEKKIVQLSGLITKGGSSDPVPFVSIMNVSYHNQQFQGNHQGYFSFVAHVGDTIRLTSIGYFPKEYVVPNTDSDRHTAEINMEEQVLMLDPVELFPWASVEEFTKEFMELDLADDNIAIANRNLSLESLRAMAAATPRNASEIHNFMSTQRHIELSNKAVNQRMNNPLLSPLAWGNFIKQITEGNKSRTKNKW